jgi:hypothetical protein
VPNCLVNRLTPEFDHPFLANRRTAELGRVAELEQSMPDVNIATMELLDDEVVGIEALRTVGARLYGEVQKHPEDLGPHIIGEAVKHSIHRGMTMHIEGSVERISLHYPGIDRDDLSLRSEDGVLFVGLNGREREVVTSVPTKASQVKAKLEGDVLHLDVPLDEA